MSGPFVSRLTTSVGKYLKADGGVAAVEFAMVAGPFFMLFLSMFEAGLMLFSEYALQSGVQEAGRLVRTGQAQNAGLSAADFREAICNKTVIIRDCEGRISVHVTSTPLNFTALQISMPNALSIGPAVVGDGPTITYTPGNPMWVTVVVATYDWKFTIPFMQAFTNINSTTRRLVTYTVFRNEPYQAAP